jgi:membrane glycosyltransferase
MAPEHWHGPPGHRDDEPWMRAAARRRGLLIALVVLQAAAGAWGMIAVLPYHGGNPLEAATLALFVVLFAWISAGFWTAVMGFWLLAFGRDRYAIGAGVLAEAPLPAEARIAVLMPICNEDVARVFAGLRATWDSLAATGEGAAFDFFVLSDSSDARARADEPWAWLNLCQATGGFGRIFYRWRRVRRKKKAGNVADFCRRWGRHYRYMVVLDADSVMSGECLVRLVRLMEANPRAGILQTLPRAAGRETLFARVQQFASRVYGPVFAAGLHFWQLGEAHYWGHNAILRVAPFMRHCALGRLSGRGPFSGEILSHDFVEAALMRRAGWGVWLAYRLEGSYEETPPSLLEELKRDRRWCKGNLLNARLFLAPGMPGAHRALFATGVMAYLSAPLWFASLVLATATLAANALVAPRYFVHPEQLFPIWPEWHPAWAAGLLAATAVLLFLPKLLALFLQCARDAEGFAGRARLALGVLAESALSMLLAPVRMMFHSKFVAAALVGATVAWRSPPRADAQTGWREALRRHGAHTLLGVAWIALVARLAPGALLWLAPVAGALVLSIPVSVLSSRVFLGRRARAAGLFVVPEEASPAPELRRLKELLGPSADAPSGLPGFGRPASPDKGLHQPPSLPARAS